MQDFPALKETEVAILFAEISTGHVMDLYFNLATEDKQIVYTICDSIDEALTKINSILKERKNVEFVIYDKSRAVLRYIHHS